MSNNISEDIKLFLDRKSTIEFLDSAQIFINFLERDNLSLQEFMVTCHSLLLELYVRGHNFEKIELKYSDENTSIDEKIMVVNKNRNIVSKLSENEFYWEIFDPIDTEMEREPVQGSLTDDLSDIYRDLKNELEKLKINTNEAIEDALWELKFSFSYHWGNHCIDALRALHYLCYDGKK